MNLQLGKKTQSRQRNVRTKAWWLRGRSGLPKSEASSFKSSFSCYWVGGGRDSLYFLNICYCGKRITFFFFFCCLIFQSKTSPEIQSHISNCALSNLNAQKCLDFFNFLFCIMADLQCCISFRYTTN